MRVTDGPLAGIRVLKLATGVAGPMICRVLANLGAEVIKVESAKRLASDHGAYLSWAPELGLVPDWHSPMRNDYHAGDINVGLELGDPTGLALFKRLVAASDVVMIAYSTPTASKLGIAYDDLRAARPDLIYLSLTSLGATGPHRDFSLWGFNIVPMTGVTQLVGYPDSDEPMGVGGITLSDFTSAYCGVIAILSAILYRSRTAKGQFIDESILEAGVTTGLGSVILDHIANARPAKAIGNRSAHAAPHGVYRCRGDDQWCSIAVRSENEWVGFCRACGSPTWTADPRFTTLAERLKHQDELDRLVEEFTMQRDPFEVMFLMQQEGVPAGVAQNNDDLLLRDLQLLSRGFFIRTPMTKQGNAITYDLPIKLSATPGRIDRGAACLGEDNDYVLKDLLGLSDGAVAELTASGVVYPFQPGDPALRNRSLTYRWTGSLGTSLPRADHLKWD